MTFLDTNVEEHKSQPIGLDKGITTIPSCSADNCLSETSPLADQEDGFFPLFDTVAESCRSERARNLGAHIKHPPHHTA